MSRLVFTPRLSALSLTMCKLMTMEEEKMLHRKVEELLSEGQIRTGMIGLEKVFVLDETSGIREMLEKQ